MPGPSAPLLREQGRAQASKRYAQELAETRVAYGSQPELTLQDEGVNDSGSAERRLWVAIKMPPCTDTFVRRCLPSRCALFIGAHRLRHTQSGCSSHQWVENKRRNGWRKTLNGTMLDLSWAAMVHQQHEATYIEIRNTRSIALRKQKHFPAAVTAHVGTRPSDTCPSTT